MPWQVLVALRIIVAHVVCQYLLKKVSGLPSRTRRFVWQFFFAAVLGLILAVVTDTPLANPRLLLIVLLGTVNSFGAYFQWRAFAISQSKTALFTWADDVIAMALAYALLQEEKFLTPLLVLGILLCIGTTFAFPFVRVRRNTHGEAHLHFQLIRWIVGYSVIWGVAAFAMRAFSLQGVALPAFIVSWYSGAFLGALFVKTLAGKKEAGDTLNARNIAGMAVVALSIWVALVLAYWQRQLAPIVVVQPIEQASEMILPAFIGLFIFREREKISWYQWILFGVACAGGFVIAYAFR